MGNPCGTPGGPLGDLWGTLEGRVTLAGPSEDPWGTLALGGPLGPTPVGPLGDPWGTLGGPLEDPWRTLGGPSEDPWRTLGGPWGALGKNCGPSPPDIRAAKVCIHVPRPKREVCVSMETAKVCIHVPAPRSEVCVQVHIAKVCIHAPGPETEVCTNVQNPQRCVYTYLRPKTRYVYKCRSLCCRQHLTKSPSRHTDFEA